MKDPIVFLPSDLYTRNKIISLVVETLKQRLCLTTLRIIDVGGRGSRLREFLPSSEEMLVLDLRPASTEKEGYVIGDMTEAPFADEKFHVVIASDLLEHIEPKSRERALAEMLRISSHYVILGAPFYSPEVTRAESIVNELHLSFEGREHPWLREHFKNGLPREDELVSYLRNNKIAFRKILTNNVLNWLLINLFYLNALSSDVPRGNIDVVFEFYNSHYEELGDGIEPTYRKIYVISRKFDIPKSLAPEPRLNPARFEELLRRIFSSMSPPTAVDAQNAITKLMSLYQSREDLQKAYPEAVFGDVQNLILWAADKVLRKHYDADLGTLRPYAPWYVQSAYEYESTRLKSELSSKAEELAERTSELHTAKEQIRILEYESTRLKSELSSKAEELAAAVSERDALSNNLKYARAELDSIRRSFGYKAMRFYATRIDRLLPDGTRRGEFKKKVVQSFRTATTEGIRSLLGRPSEKLKIRGIRIAEPIPLLCCDYPQLSATEVAKVSDSIMLTGWAISEKGIREVRVYLDGTLLGAASYGISRLDVGRAFPNFPDSHLSGFRKIIVLEGKAREGPHVLKIVAEGKNRSSAMVEGVIQFAKTTLIETIAYEDIEEKRESINARPSVVILTKSPPADFEQTLERITNQKGIEGPEIIIINSGAEDMSHFAKRYGAKIFNVSPEEFGHGKTRNYGAEQATGHYAFFMTDDAIPASKHLLSDMIKILESDEKVVAATARQIPRTDADLMACQAIWGYYRMLALDSDRVVSSIDLDRLAPVEKRRFCQIDDVCSCFRRDVFLKYKYDADIASAEDLELGIRLIRDGFKIAQLFSTGVVHSHNWPPSYHLKRTYVDVKTLCELLHDESTALRTPDGQVPSLYDLLDYALDLYDMLSFALDELRENGFHKGDISMTFRTIEKRPAGARDREAPKARNPDLLRILTEMTALVHHKRRSSLRSNPMSLGYLAYLRGFQEWLSSTHQSIIGIESEFCETIYKLLGAEIGRTLGSYHGSLRADKSEPVFAHLDRFLSEGV